MSTDYTSNMLHIRMDPDVYRELDQFCDQTRRSRTAAVNYILHDWLATNRQASNKEQA